jgi:hypothetical protein
MKLNLGEVLTKAWQITWKFKVLWIFGILASCSGSNRGNFNSGSGGGNGSGGSGGNQMPDMFRQFENMNPEQAISSFLQQYGGIILAVILLLCVLWIVFYFLGVMGRIGLIRGAGKADSGAESMSFGELWTESLPYFWRMFGLNLLVGLPFFLLTVMIIVGVLFAGLGVASGNGNMSEGGIVALILGAGGILLGLLCIIGILATIVGLIVEQVQNAIVLEDRGLFDGFGRGWSVFRDNWISVVVVGLILWVVGIVLGIVIAIPIVLAVLPLAVGAGLAAANDSWLMIAIITLACVVIMLPITLVLSGVTQTYYQSVWTLAYRRLTGLGAPAAPASPEPAPLEQNLEPQ